MSTPTDSQPKKPTLEELIEWGRKYVDSLTLEEKMAMLKNQGESWARAEAQWAKDFKEGKTERD